MIILSVLYFMDSVNVEVREEGDLHRRDRKRAEKRGWPISATVKVRRSLSRNSSRSTNPQARMYSHQFEVAGRYNHVTRGPHVRCGRCKGDGTLHASDGSKCPRCKGTGLDPNKVKACARREEGGALTCPDGCRREWIPKHVKGPEDKPLVLKTRDYGELEPPGRDAA